MRGGELYAWQRHGYAVLLDDLPDGALRVTVVDETVRATATLDTSERESLVDALVGHAGCVPDDQYHYDLGQADRARERAEVRQAELEDALARAEGERDEAREILRDTRRHLADAVAEVERLKTALDMADTRARGLEADLDELRAEARDDGAVMMHHRCVS